MNLSTKLSILLVLFLAAFYQGIVKTTLFTTLGIGREIQPISSFPDYQCRRIHDPRLQACEDMWLSEETRQLFLACSSSLARSQWMPNIGRFNASGRSLEDAVIAMDIDKPKGNSFVYSVLSTPDFPGVHNDGHLHLVGFTGRNKPSSAGKSFTTELHLVNARPSVDPSTGAMLDNEKAGPNMTIESFTLSPDSTEMHHIQTWYNQDVIKTPNNIALDASHGLWFTNDHGTATHGLSHSLAPFIANGDISYCSSPTSCRVVTDGLKFPNGLHMDHEASRLYVPSASIGGIRVYRYGVDRRLEQVSYIDIDLPIDNLSQDRNGDIWAAAMPRAWDTLRAMRDPLGVVAPSTVFRIRRGLEGWVVEKVLEDRDAEVLPGATTVVHDVQTGRIFLSGVTSAFITVCDRVEK